MSFWLCEHGKQNGVIGTTMYFCDECQTKNHISDGGDNASYYELPKGCERVQDLIMEMGMSWNQGNILKSCIRWDKKPDLEYNLRKIIFFAQDELDRLYERDRPTRD